MRRGPASPNRENGSDAFGPAPGTLRHAQPARPTTGALAVSTSGVRSVALQSAVACDPWGARMGEAGIRELDRRWARAVPHG